VWKSALEKYSEPEMDPAIAEELTAYVDRRRIDIASGEP
jgi:trimethylamine:corrinoid methyltransferase-like protein